MWASAALRTVNFSLQRAMGSHCGAQYRRLLALEGASRNELEALIRNRTERLLRSAKESVPYYRERVACGTAADEIENWPILSKQCVRDYFEELMTPALRAEVKPGRRKGSYGWAVVKTGGTTGEPTTVIHDSGFRDAGRAVRYLGQARCGFPLGTPYFRLWGSITDISMTQDSAVARMHRRLARERVLNAFHMEARDMRDYVQQMNASKAAYLMAYADCAGRLADFIRAEGVRPPKLKAVMSCAGTMTAELRQKLADVFGARVHNNYGSRECSGIACECAEGGLHIFTPVVLVEVVDQAGKRVPFGQTGRILVTLLENLQFPMIRYEIGDMGSLSAEVCSCGRPAPLLQAVEGRSAEFLLSETGGAISPVFIRHMVGVVHNPGFIKRFQATQYAANGVRFQLEIDPAVPDATVNETWGRLRGELGRVFGEGVEIAFQRTDYLQEADNGKFLYCVNELRRR